MGLQAGVHELAFLKINRLIMPTSKKSKLITENAVLAAGLLEAEEKINVQSSAKVNMPKNDFFDSRQNGISLKESEVRYRRLFETAKDAILILEGDTGRIVDANPFLQDMLGYSKTELIGKALWEIGPVKDIPASQEAMRHLQDNDYIRYDNIPLQTKSGETKQVEFVSNVYLVNGWRVIQCNIRDITARKHAEALVQTSNEELLVLVDELQWRDKEMQLLNHLNDLLQSCLTQDEAYQVIALSATELFRGHNGCLAIMNGTDQRLEVVARWGPDAIVASAFSLKDCWALRRGQPHEVSDPQTGLMCQHFVHTPLVGYLCLPLTVQGETLGLLCMFDHTSHKSKYQLGLQQLSVTFGETIKLSLSNLKLRDELRYQTIHDTLSGLFNRRYLDEILPRELHLANRRAIALCVVMLDIDGFKHFNDSWGHAAGDLLLCEFGGVLREHLRKSDIYCRYGGDEFVLVMPDSSASNAQERVKKISTFLKGLEIHYSEQTLGKVTLSAGIAQAPENGTTASQLLRAADEALYTAKQNGRNCIVIYEAKPQL